MKNEDVDFIKKNLRWPFVWMDIFNKYLVLIAPLFFIFMSFVVSYFSIKKYSDNSFLVITIPTFLFGGLLFYWILIRIETENKFKIIPFSYQQIALQTCFNQLGWTLSSQNTNVITVTTKRSFYSYGQKITIILDDKQMLFNSLPQYNQAFTFNRDKIHYRNICNALQLQEPSQ